MTNLLEFFKDVTGMVDREGPADVVYLDCWRALEASQIIKTSTQNKSL